MAHEVIYGDWTHEHPGFYRRSDGAEVIRTGSRTWTLSMPFGNPDTNHRTARAAMSHADHQR